MCASACRDRLAWHHGPVSEPFEAASGIINSKRGAEVIKKITALTFLALTSCAWNPVVTPYAYKGAAKVNAAETAVVWGFYDGTELMFIELDGKTLRSRGGGGRPISLSLLPGTYTANVYFKNIDGRYAYVDLPMTVEAGHTYVVEHKISSDNQRVGLQLKDLGMQTICRYERYEQWRGSSRLICQESGG